MVLINLLLDLLGWHEESQRNRELDAEMARIRAEIAARKAKTNQPKPA